MLHPCHLADYPNTVMSSICAVAPISVFHHHGYTPTIILSHHITSCLSLCLPPTVLTNCSNNHYMWGATLLHFHGYTPIITHPPLYCWPLTIIIHLHHLPHIATVISHVIALMLLLSSYYGPVIRIQWSPLGSCTKWGTGGKGAQKPSPIFLDIQETL